MIQPSAPVAQSLNRHLIVVATLILLLSACSGPSSDKSPVSGKPNIVVIYIDDLGYGDVGCYGANDVKTPNVDFLAEHGLRFTDAHCGASTCTPSRFTLLTGKYAFRNDAAVLPGDAPLLIEPGSETLPAMLQRAGYTTGIVGKWHLGLGRGTIDWNDSIAPGPLETGFDYSFIIPATTDRVPCVFVENHRVYNLDPADPIRISYQHKIGDEPTGLEHPEELKMAADTQHSCTIVNGISRIGYMEGGHKAWWTDEDIADVLTARAREFIDKHRKQPFFLYFAVPDIHVPRAPNARFVGSTTMGRRGDAITEMDWMTGEIRKELEKLGLDRNTLVIFSSDNGPVLDDGYADSAVEKLGDHKPWGKFSGGKYSALEAGTRVPMIVYWPGAVKTGVSKSVFSQVDLESSLATLVKQPLETDAAPDSYNQLDVLLGKSDTGRDYMLEESYTLSIRKGPWKYIAPQKNPTPEWLKNKKIATGLEPVPQLYNLQTDAAEKSNVAAAHPDIVKEMAEELKRIQTVNGTRADHPVKIQ